MNQLQDDLALSHLGRDPWTYLWKRIFCSLLISLSEKERARLVCSIHILRKGLSTIYPDYI